MTEQEKAMAKKKKQLDKVRNSIRIKYFTNTNKMITPKLEKEYMQIFEKLWDTQTNDIEYDVLSNNKSFKIEKSYYGELVFRECSKKSIYNKYIYGGVSYNKLEDIKKDEKTRKLNRYFSVGSNVIRQDDTFEQLLKKYPLSCIATRRSNLAIEDDLTNLLLPLFKEHKEIDALMKVDKDIFKNMENLGLILDVIEGGDSIRYAKVLVTENDIEVYAFNTESAIYNYIDRNRLVCITGYSNLNTWAAFDIVTDFKLLKQVANNCSTFFEKSIQKYNFRDRHYTFDEILSMANRIRLEDAKAERERKIAEIKNQKYKEKIKAMDNDTTYFEKNEIKFYKSKMVYENIVFDMKDKFNFQSWLQDRDIDSIADFNDIFNSALGAVVNHWSYEGQIPWNISHSLPTYNVDKVGKWSKAKSIELFINGIEITLSKKDNYYYINDIRINKNELVDCLKHILCYADEEKYLKFLQNVSECSLKFHKAISNGIKKDFNMEGVNTCIELKLKRKKNRNYIIVGKGEYRVTNTNKLIDYNGSSNFGGSSIYENMLIMLLDSTELDFKQLPLLVSEGIERYTKALQKSQELLDKTIKLFKVKTKRIDGDDGYIVTGKSGTTYWIQDNDRRNGHDTYKVWELNANLEKNNNGYRCIVDTSAKNQIGKDALCARIYALANDTMVAKNISTLRV